MSIKREFRRTIAVFGALTVFAIGPTVAHAAMLETAEGRSRYNPGEQITVIFDGAVTSPMDHLLLERADGTKIESYPLGIRPNRAQGAWQFRAKPGSYVVRWIAAEGPNRAWTLKERAEIALIVGPPAQPVERWQVDRPDQAEPDVAEPEIVMPDEPVDLDATGRGEIETASPSVVEPDPAVTPQPIVLRAPRSRDWTRVVDNEHGTEIAYPSNIFEPVESEEGAEGREFVSRDGEARFGIYAGQQSETLKDMRKRFLSDPDYGRVTYKPKSKSWFVLSGYRGENVFYEKYILHRSGVLHAFALEFPNAQRALYAPIVERMEDSFRPG